MFQTAFISKKQKDTTVDNLLRQRFQCRPLVKSMLVFHSAKPVALTSNISPTFSIYISKWFNVFCITNLLNKEEVLCAMKFSKTPPLEFTHESI